MMIFLLWFFVVLVRECLVNVIDECGQCVQVVDDFPSFVKICVHTLYLLCKFAFSS